jgi:hypothetical protein
MSVYISYPDATGLSLTASIERLSDNYAWDNVAKQFASSVTFTNKKIALVEGTSENAGTYIGKNAGDLGDAGDILLRVHDLNDSNVSLATAQAYIIGGIELTRTQDVPLTMANIISAFTDAAASIQIVAVKERVTHAALSATVKSSPQKLVESVNPAFAND